MTAYLDTNVVLWLASKDLKRITPKAMALLRKATLLISPAVLLELEYLHEIGRSAASARVLQRKLASEAQVSLCDLAFPLVIEAALDEGWTREPFDRLIVAQAKARGNSPLVTADTRIRKHYTQALW